MTNQDGLTPPEAEDELAAFRRRMLDLPEPQVKKYEFVVVGGGIAGMCAATAAARLGCKVALVNDRPVLGGNNSAEVRVHLGGHVEIGPNKGLGRMIQVRVMPSISGWCRQYSFTAYTKRLMISKKAMAHTRAYTIRFLVRS